MSDEGMDQIERADDRADRADDVEAHGMDQIEGMDQVEAHGMDQIEGMDQAAAQDEPPDVEGHQLGGRMDPRPVD